MSVFVLWNLFLVVNIYNISSEPNINIGPQNTSKFGRAQQKIVQSGEAQVNYYSSTKAQKWGSQRQIIEHVQEYEEEEKSKAKEASLKHEGEHGVASKLKDQRKTQVNTFNC